MITNKNILDLVAEYVKTKNLAVFAAAFSDLFYDIEKTGDPAAIQLSYDIESMLASLTAGVCSENEFYGAMKALSPSVSVFNLTLGDEPAELTALASLTKWMVVGAAAGTPSAPVDISPSVGFGSTTVPQDARQTNIGPPPWQQVLTAL